MPIYAKLEDLSQKKRPITRIVFAMLTAAFLMIMTFAIWGIWTLRSNDLQEAEVATANITRVLASHAETSMKVADIVLEGVVERIAQEGLSGQQEQLRNQLEHMAAKASELQGLFVYDEHGKWIATSLGRDFKANNSDRDYFKYHKANTNGGLRISAPIRSRSTGIWIIPISRRLEHPDGSFAGVALATMRLNFFEGIYGSLDVGKTGTILFALDNGTLLYRRPLQETIIGTDISSGPLMQLYRAKGAVATAMLTARIDKVTRLYSYRHLENYPLIVAAALSEEEIYSNWNKTALIVCSTVLLFVLVLFTLTKRVLRQINIRDRLEKQLHLVTDGLTNANQELSQLAWKDGLTQLANRRAFDLELAREYALAIRKKVPFSLILLDVDWFKKFNDGYGHQEGDKCLQQVAQVLTKEVTRQSDIVARYGGEEFAVLLPDTDADGAKITAERIRFAVAQKSIHHEFAPENIVTVSVGSATFNPLNEPHLTSADLIKRTDAALYRSKELGRNRVTAMPE